MKLVRAGFCDNVYHCTGIAPILGIKRVGQHPKFLDAVRRRLDGGQIRELVVSVAAIHRKVVVASATSVYAHHAGPIASI